MFARIGISDIPNRQFAHVRISPVLTIFIVYVPGKLDGHNFLRSIKWQF
jgi:hypothetical protein